MKDKDFHNPEDFIGVLLKLYVEPGMTGGYKNDDKECGCHKDKDEKDDQNKDDDCCQFCWCFKQEVCCEYEEFIEAARCALREWCSYCDEQKTDEPKEDCGCHKNECCKFDYCRKQAWCRKYKEYLRASKCAFMDWCCHDDHEKDEHEDCGCHFNRCQKKEICCKYDEFLEVLECAFNEWCECFDKPKKDEQKEDGKRQIKTCRMEWCEKCDWCRDYEDYLKALKCALEDWCCKDCDCCKWPSEND